MNEITTVGDSLATNEKISALQSIILEHANEEKAAMAADARQQAQQWLGGEMAKLERETASVLADAKTRAEDMHRRQILSADREKSTETLRLQNRLLQDAMKRFLDALVHLRERTNYADILAALATNAAKSLQGSAPLRLRLCAIDAALGDEVASRVNKSYPEAGMTFDHEPAPILGGCWVASADGRRQINSDWQSRMQETADLLAERLLPLL